MKTETPVIGEILFRMVKSHGSGAHVIVPKAWFGQTLKCEVIDPNDRTKSKLNEDSH